MAARYRAGPVFEPPGDEASGHGGPGLINPAPGRPRPILAGFVKERPVTSPAMPSAPPAQPPAPSSLRNPAAAWLVPLALLCFSVVSAAVISPPPQGGQAVAAVFPPWWSAQRAVLASASAGAAVLRIGAWHTVVLVQSPRTGLARRLRAAGAWLVVDPHAAAFCHAARPDRLPI